MVDLRTYFEHGRSRTYSSFDGWVENECSPAMVGLFDDAHFRLCYHRRSSVCLVPRVSGVRVGVLIGCVDRVY